MKFKYKAKTKEGKVKKGTIEAPSQRAAGYILEKYGFFAISFKEVSKESFLEKRMLFKKVSFKEVIVFTRQLSVMFKSAISPVKALRSQVFQIENPDFRAKVLKITEAVEGGSSLSSAFSLFPTVFDQFYVNIVKSGEATGKVADYLNYLSSHLEREYNLKQKIKSAMIYPAFVIIVFVAVFFLATFFIIPKLTKILEAFGGELPFVTRVVISFSNFVKDGGWLLIVLFFLTLFILPPYLKRFYKTKEAYDKILLKIPVVGEFNKKINLVRFSENFSVLISAGLPVTQALKIIQEIVSNVVYKKIIKEAWENVSKGEKISSVFGRYPREVSPFLLQMMITGEEAGRLDETLMEVVNFYQAEIDRLIARLPTIIEPLLILILGIGVAVLAVSIFIPLFKIGLGGMGL